jgi:UDPglucose 6-dehydrogenase
MMAINGNNVKTGSGRKARDGGMKIAMIGTGYVGLVTGACFADWGHNVVCVDKDEAKIEGLKKGIMPIYEPGLEELVAKCRSEGKIAFTTRLADALVSADAVFIAVGTPPRASDGEADLTYIFQAAREIGQTLRDYAVVVVKSTVPVGTGATVERILSGLRPEGSFSVVSNPEFLREGSAIGDFQNPDRVVIGSEDETALGVMLEIYRPIQEARLPVVTTKRKTSELIKYAANAFLATKITFINEIADLCEQVDADVRELALGVGLDNRIGRNFLNVGPGYGGSCFPKDTMALLRTAQDHGVALRLVEETVAANNARKRKMALKVADALGGRVDGACIAVLGLAFKANTDDMRDAPSIPLIEALQRAGASINAHDPVGMKHARRMLEDVTFFDDPYSCVEGADAVVIATEWESFKSLDFKRLASLMRGDAIVDLRNILSEADVEANGLRLTSLGRAPRVVETARARVEVRPASAPGVGTKTRATTGVVH